MVFVTHAIFLGIRLLNTNLKFQEVNLLHKVSYAINIINHDI